MFNFYKECSDFLHFNQVSRFVGLFNNEIGRWKAQILTDLATLLFLVFIFSVIAHEIWQNSLNKIENGFSLEIKKTSKNQNNKIEQFVSPRSVFLGVFIKKLERKNKSGKGFLTCNINDKLS
jgi:hypothetical protein